MPFCTSCGSAVEPQARFCRHCGAQQAAQKPPFTPPPSTHPPSEPFLNDISDRTAIILCYIPVFGIIPSVICLAAHRYRHNYRVRFNAFQGLYLFVVWLVVSSAIPSLLWSAFPGGGLEHALLHLVQLALIFCWIYMLARSAQERPVSLPILGDLAARSAQEQI